MSYTILTSFKVKIRWNIYLEIITQDTVLNGFKSSLNLNLFVEVHTRRTDRGTIQQECGEGLFLFGFWHSCSTSVISVVVTIVTQSLAAVRIFGIFVLSSCIPSWCFFTVLFFFLFWDKIKYFPCWSWEVQYCMSLLCKLTVTSGSSNGSKAPCDRMPDHTDSPFCENSFLMDRKLRKANSFCLNHWLTGLYKSDGACKQRPSTSFMKIMAERWAAAP